MEYASTALVNSSSVRLSICLPTYNRLSHLKWSLSNLIDAFQGISYEIIIVDGGSTDGTLDHVKELQKTKPIILIEQNGLQGYVRACQAAIDLARGEYIIFRSDHSLTNPQPIIEAMRLLKAVPELGLVFEKIYKFPRKINKATIVAGYLGSMEAFVIRQRDKFRLEHIYVSYGWPTDKILQVMSSGKIVAGLKETSWIDTTIDAPDMLHRKFKSRDHSGKPVLDDGRLLRERSDAIQKIIESSLSLIEKCQLSIHRFMFKQAMSQMNALPARGLSKLFSCLGFKLSSIIPETYKGEAERSLNAHDIDQRSRVPYWEPILDWLQEKCCPFVDRSLIPAEFRQDFYLVQQLPAHICQTIQDARIWGGPEESLKNMHLQEN